MDLSGFNSPAFRILAQPDEMPKPKKPKSRGGFLSSLISEGGGLAGALKGGAVGSAFGPLGSLIGAGVGGFGGTFLGRLAENKVRDNEYRAADALKEGVTSGVLSASPFKLLKGGGAAAKALATGNKVMPAVSTAITKPGIATRVLGSLGNRATTASLRATPSQLKNFVKETGEDVVPFMQRNKLIGKGADDLKSLRPGFQATYDDAINSVDAPIALEDVLKMAREGEMGKLIGSASSSSRKLGLQSVDELGQALGRGRAKQFSAKDILDVKRDFDRSIKNYKFDDAAKAVPQNISDLLKSVLRTASPEAKKAGQEVSKLNKLINIAEGQENVGRGTLPFGITDLLAGGVGAGVGGVGGGIGGLAAGILGKKVVSSPKVLSTVAKVSSSAAKRGADRAASPAGLSSLARRVLPVRGGEAILGGMQQEPDVSTPDSNTMLPSMSPLEAGAGSILSGGFGAPLGMPQSVYSREAVAQDIQNDLLKTGGENMDKYIKLFEFLNPETSANAKPGYGKPSAEKYALATSGLSSLDSLTGMLSEDSSLVGKTSVPGQSLPLVGGFLSKMIGTGDYQPTAWNVIDSLARARTGAAIRPSEEAFYTRLLPRAGDSPSTVQLKIQQLKDAFSPFVSYGSGSPDAADILSALQGAY